MAVPDLFQQYLGRAPSSAELSGFTNLINSGQISELDLQTYLQSTPEYQQRQMPQMMQNYQNYMQGGANSFVGNLLSRGYDQANSQAYMNGRPQSSSLGAMFAQTAGNIAGNMGSQYLGGLQNYYGNYMGNTQGRQFGLGQSAYDPQTLRSRQWQNQDFQRMQDFYNNYASSQRGGMFGAGLGGLGGAVLGGAIGGYFPNAIGGAAGMKMGAGLGSMFGGGLGS